MNESNLRRRTQIDRFTIRAELKTPIILSPLTLDGLLGAILFNQTQDVDKAHAAIPIRCTDGLFHASVAMLQDVFCANKHSLIAGLRATHDLDLQLIKQSKSGQPHRTIGLQRRREFGNVMSTYQATAAGSIQWHAEGDAEHVLSLLEDVDFIGKKRSAGFGQVHHWQLLESDLDGIVGPDSYPLRPVPLDQWSGATDAVKADAAWKPAYWLPAHRAICVVPSLEPAL